MNRRTAPRRTVPLVVLAVVAAVPAVVFIGVWQLAEARLDQAAAAPVTAPVEASGDAVEVGPSALDTALLSFRRQPGSIAERVAVTRAETESNRRIAELTAAFGERASGTSCLRVVVNGDPVVDVGASVVPASTQKLLVAAVALDVLGPSFRYRTEVRSPSPVDGTIPGDLVLAGGGDPLLTTSDFTDPQRYPAFNTTSLDQLADLVVAAGVRAVDGAVVGDGARYDDEFRVPSWGSAITNFDAGPYDALLVDDGFLDDGNHGLVPARSAAARFVELLRARGVAVADGAANADRTARPGETTLAVVESVPLSEVLVEMLHTSDNNTAELVLKEIGFQAAGIGSRSAGLDVIRSRLADWALPVEGVVLEDGSGLSRSNRVDCALLAGLLGATPVAEALVDLLPAAGRDGTLSTRLLGTPAEGRLRGKTGTLSGVKALVGEQPDSDGEPVVFALVLNGDSVDDPAIHDPIWRALVDFIDRLPVEVDVDTAEFAPRADITSTEGRRVEP